MKKIILFIFLLLCGLSAYSQNGNFSKIFLEKFTEFKHNSVIPSAPNNGLRLYERNHDMHVIDSSNVSRKLLTQILANLEVVADSNGSWIKISADDGSKDSVFLEEGENISITIVKPDLITISSTSPGATFTLFVEKEVVGAYVKILGSDGGKDSVLLSAGTNMTSIVCTDANTVTFNADAGGSGATYTMQVVEAANGAYIKILGSDGSKDSVLLLEGSNITMDISGDHIISFTAASPPQYWQRTSTTLTPVTAGDIISDGTATLNSGILNQANINLTLPALDHGWSGITISLPAGETVAFGQIGYLGSGGKVLLTDGDAYLTSCGTFVALGAGGDGDTISWLIYGLVRDDDRYSFTSGNPLYLSGSIGAITATIPTAVNAISQYMGIAITTHIILFKPEIANAEIK